jgi:GT2 family glycosyltransferase
MPRAAVVIPSWNGRALLARCLQALSRQSERDFVTIVVDNGSSDGTADWLRENYPAVQLISNTENRGFARAVNQGIQASKGPYVAVLNNDTEPEPQWLRALLAASDAEPGIGMVASKMVFADRPHVINSAGICVDLAGIAWDRFGGRIDDPTEAAPVEIFGPCGGAALYSRAMLDEIGLFDESFFAYLEDVDLAWRGRVAGWHCLYAPAARVLHRHSATAGEGSPFKRYHLGRNKVWLLAKNYPFAELAWAAPLVILYDFAATLYALFARRDLQALRGRVSGLATIGPRLRKRQHVKPRPDIAFLSPLVLPWRVSDRYAHLRKHE